MPELRGIVPRPARVDKVGRCAEGLSVKTMLVATGATLRLELPTAAPLWTPVGALTREGTHLRGTTGGT